MRFLLALATAWLLLLPGAASAAYSCNISSSGFRTAYDPTVATTNITQSSVTINCTRASGDSTSMPFSLSADNGLNPKGINNQAFLAPNNFLRYDIYMDGSCGTQWKGNNTFNGPLIFPSGQLSATANVTYWGCIASAQNVAAGVYGDTVNMKLSYGPNPQSSTGLTPFPVSIATPATCALTQPPGTLNFGIYPSLSPVAVNGSAQFGVTCTSYLPYTMAISPGTGTLVGLNYTLSLATPSSTGTGALQNFTVDGTIAAGQAGVCGTATCTGQNTHTLTITY
ncbi:MAG TPA: spore coat protein U domain-containing protein [Ramlibacter sp.]